MASETEAVDSRICLALELTSKSREGALRNPRVLTLLALFLEKTIKRNEKLMETTKRKGVVTIFHGTRAPTLSIQQYIDRIYKYSNCSPSCFVVAQIYMDRFLQQANVLLTSLNSHRLFHPKRFLNNAYYAKVGGVSTPEMNRMEIKFLFSLDFKLYVKIETFERYCLQLEREGNGIEMYQIKHPIQVVELKERQKGDERSTTNAIILNSGAEGSVAIPRNLSSFQRVDISFGDHISKAIDLSWEATENDIIGGLRGTLSKLLEICESKLRTLKLLETQVS